MTMLNIMNDVWKFHKACDIEMFDKPDFPNPGIEYLRLKLVFEEANELREACRIQSLPDIADAIADAIYVLVGMALVYGIPLHKVWDAVQKANMAKVDPVTGKVIKREDGKILKPAGWMPPDIEAIIKEASK